MRAGSPTSNRPIRMTIVGVFALVGAACSAGDETRRSAAQPDLDGTSAVESTAAPALTPETTVVASEPPTTAAPAAPLVYDGIGPYAAGVVTLLLTDRAVDVYYPVDPEVVAGQPTEIFETISVFPEALRPAVPVELQGTFDTGAVRDAPASDAGPFPVVVYSHGFGGYRQVSTFHVSHLASWGFVVAAADHLERGILAQATGAVQNAPGHDVQDVRDTLALLDAENSGDGSRLAGIVDLDHVGITGHSAGAGTAVRAALEVEGIDSFVAISGGPAVTVSGDDVGVRFASVTDLLPGEYEVVIESSDASTLTASVDGGEPQTVALDDAVLDVDEGSITLAVPEGGSVAPGTITVTLAVPTLPALVVIGEDDAIVSAERSTALYDDLGAPKWLVNVAGAGHNSFTDTCPAILDRGGLEALRPLIGGLVDLAQDGCTPGVTDPLLVQRVLDHYSTAFFRQTLLGTDESAALTEAAAAAIEGIELARFEST